MYKVKTSSGEEYGPADLDQIVQWAREGRIERDSLLIRIDGSETKSVSDEPRVMAVLGTPPTIPGPQPPIDDAPLSGLIPYKNPPALIGYYVGIFSCFPIVGLLLGPPAIVMGIIGIRRRKAEPERKGLAHAWIAITLGTIGTCINLFLTIALIVGLVTEA